MPRLLYSSASPYSAKVRMAAAYAGVAIEAVQVNTEQEPADLVGANPLGKIPVLVLDDGRAVFDSRVIVQYLNGLSKNALLPRNITTQIFSAMLENQAGFYAAQMAAMDNATRNAGDMINSLTIKYNRTRQAQITKELIEIISGAEAL